MGKASRAKPEKLAVKLASVRRQLGLTHEELINKLDSPNIPLYRASISQYESGKAEPPLPILLKYARLANIYVEVLIDDNISLPHKIPAQVKDPV